MTEQDLSVYTINLATLNQILAGAASPSYLNQAFQIRGYVDVSGNVLADDVFRINVYQGRVVFLDITEIYIARQGSNEYYFVFVADTNGDLILFAANQSIPTVIGKWVSNSSTNTLTFTFYKSCKSSLIGYINVTMTVDATTNSVTSVTSIDGATPNGSPVEIEISGVVGQTTSRISTGQVQMFVGIKAVPNSGAQFIIEQKLRL
jgi:hypothetical protein